jgi:translation initiation factor IF-2
MSVRLSKACKDLNIGMNTAVDFLHKKGHEVSLNPNTKLTDDEYLILAKEFNKDMALKLESEKLSQERQSKEKGESISIEGYKEKEKKESVVKATPSTDLRPQIKEVGHIDLDTLQPTSTKKTTKSKEEVEEKEVAVEKTETKHEEPPTVIEVVEEKEIPAMKENLKSAEIETVTEEISHEEPIFENETEDTLDEDEDEVELDEDVEVEKENEEEKIFRIGKPKTTPKPVVIGKIDLDSINQTTRPKSKTKEQRKKEREERIKQQTEQKNPKKTDTTKDKTPNDASQVKRKRISKQRVDINKPETFEIKKGGQQKSNFKKPIKTEVNEEDVQKQIKETLARLSKANNKRGKGAKYRQEKREQALSRMQEQAELERSEEKILKLTEFVTVSELAVMMNVSVNQIIATCMAIGMMVSINQRLDAETINIVADEFGYKTEFVSQDVVEALQGIDEGDSPEDLEPRAPIVTVMGHVDHGKTSLLDYIRSANVIAGEAGGITQHIGAYNVKLENGQRITFLDTPGHEAFTAMRARGAKVTDIAIIIVAADDDVMPQTKEAINHAAAANVPIVFAINKVDKPTANPEKIKEALANLNYLVEDWGGKYQSQEISAKKGIGIKELLEKVLLEAELLDLKANPNKNAVGSIIESELDKGRGYVSTILIQSGTLKQGDVILAGTSFGRIKAMFNERNQRIEVAKPSEPVLILGLNGAPQAGDIFNVVDTEQEAKEITNKREQLKREQSIRTKKHFTLDELGRRIALGDFKEMNLIVKGDVDGSVEALADSLLKLSTENIQVNVIHKAVGAISDSDILLAAASNALIVGFQVRPVASARKLAEKEEIDIRLYSIIYDAIEEIKSAMEGMLSPEIKEEITATLEIQEVFRITKVGAIAGCIVREGKIKRGNKLRLIRDGIVIHTGEMDSLKRYKEDVKEVGVNFECGVSFKNYHDLQEGDIIESFEEVEVKQSL